MTTNSAKHVRNSTVHLRESKHTKRQTVILFGASHAPLVQSSGLGELGESLVVG